MNEQARLKKQIYELDFAIHELVLFLDTHPASRKAMELMQEYRARRKELVAEYEKKYGNFILTTDDVPVGERWKWLDGPWPWDNDFMEA